MGLFKSQLANVVEWEEYRDDVIFYKWNNSEIKKGSRLIIRPGQDAIFLYNGVTEGVFEKEGNLYTTSELFSEEEIDDFFDCGVEDIENIIDICKAYDVNCPHEFRLTYNVISKSFDSNYNYDNVTEVLDKDVLELVEDWFKSVTKTLLNDRR